MTSLFLFLYFLACDEKIRSSFFFPDLHNFNFSGVHGSKGAWDTLLYVDDSHESLASKESEENGEVSLSLALVLLHESHLTSADPA